jgi:hypothetical protein
MALLVAAMVAGFGAGRSGSPALAQTAAQQPLVATLYNACNPCGGGPLPFIPTGGLQVRQDIPDLRAVCCANFTTPLNDNDLAKAITVSTPTAVAVYADINYSGTCETFFGPGLRPLDITTIGQNTISSIKMNATCLGPTTGKPIVTDVKVVTSPNGSAIPSCPSGYSRSLADLNAGLETPGIKAGQDGDHIFVCTQYGPANATSGVTDAKIVGPFDCASNCVDTNFNTPSKACPGPAALIMTNLNSGVVGFNFDYLCVTKATGAGQTYLRDIRFAVIPFSTDVTDATCGAVLNVPSGALPLDIQGNANAPGDNAGALFSVSAWPAIYLCRSTYAGPAAAQSLGPTPPTLTARVTNLPANCSMACPPPSQVSPGQLVTVPGTVFVQWICSAKNDNAANKSGTTIIAQDGSVVPATVTPGSLVNGGGAVDVVHSNQNLWSATVTGQCYDAWGNITTTSFHFLRLML